MGDQRQKDQAGGGQGAARSVAGRPSEPHAAQVVAACLYVAEGTRDVARIAFLLERGREETVRVKAYRNAAAAILPLGDDAVREAVEAGTLTKIAGVGASTAKAITSAVNGEMPERLAALEQEHGGPLTEGGRDLHALLKGDCHSHTLWSDGGATVEQMARSAMAMGHEYLVVTDHSPRLTVAHGLSPERLAEQLDEIAEVNERLAPFRILTGMEVDILVDGSLDLPDELLARLDVVVASVHSKLSMPSDEMTRRMVMAVASPHVDILGHCTGRKVVGTGRAQSRFDADLVFAACAQFDTAVEINCRPERQDPPEELLALALEWGCWISIDTDAHAPGQLEWQPYGCDKAVRCGVDPARIVNTWEADELLSWTDSHAA